jgi:hypothetical protein
MKKLYFAIFGTLAVLSSFAQNWVNGGNTLAATGTIGTNSSHSLLFETAGVERGRITNGGNWAIGSVGTTSRFTINVPAGVSPFRAQVNAVTKLIVGSNGGLSIGTANAGPANGLYVVGSTGIGTAVPQYKLHVEGTIYGKSTNSTGVFGYSSYSGGTGVHGQALNTGVYGYAGVYGVYGVGTNTNAFGVYGVATQAGGKGVYGSGVYGVYGLTPNGGGTAVYGLASQASAYGVFGSSTQSIGVYGYTGNSSSWAGFFAGRVMATSYSTSDRNLKKDITEVDNAMEILAQLKPKTYTFREDGEYALMNLPRGKHYGLIAQEVEEVLPALVAEAEFEPGRIRKAVRDAKGEQGTYDNSNNDIIKFKALNYTELIPLVVKALQEQQEQIDVLKAENQSLKEMITDLGGTSSTLAWMKQNTPNPVRSSTTIQYFIPAELKSARILVSNAKGQQLKIYSVSGSGTVNFSAGTLPSGTYTYSLVADGKTISTKKLVIVRL